MVYLPTRVRQAVNQPSANHHGPPRPSVTRIAGAACRQRVRHGIWRHYDLVLAGFRCRTGIGSTDLVEFAVAIATYIASFTALGFGYWRVVARLVTGGVVAASLAAYLSKRIKPRPMPIALGFCIVLPGCYTIPEAVFDFSLFDNVGIGE